MKTAITVDADHGTVVGLQLAIFEEPSAFIERQYIGRSCMIAPSSRGSSATRTGVVGRMTCYSICW